MLLADIQSMYRGFAVNKVSIVELYLRDYVKVHHRKASGICGEERRWDGGVEDDLAGIAAPLFDYEFSSIFLIELSTL